MNGSDQTEGLPPHHPMGQTVTHDNSGGGNETTQPGSGGGGLGSTWIIVVVILGAILIALIARRSGISVSGGGGANDENRSSSTLMQASSSSSNPSREVTATLGGDSLESELAATKSHLESVLIDNEIDKVSASFPERRDRSAARERKMEATVAIGTDEQSAITAYVILTDPLTSNRRHSSRVFGVSDEQVSKCSIVGRGIGIQTIEERSFTEYHQIQIHCIEQSSYDRHACDRSIRESSIGNAQMVG